MGKTDEEYEQAQYQPPLNPELANMLQQEATQALGSYGMPQGMMLGNGAGLGMMPGQFYRMPQMGGDLGLEEEPLYVNAKQYHRILKRRQARARLEAQLKIQREKKPYMHESRHRHAMRRPRGPGGRFLTGPEIAEMRAKEEAEKKAGKVGGKAGTEDSETADD